MRKVSISQARHDLSKVLRQAAREEIVIIRRGKPAGILIGFDSEDDWFDYRIENDPRFLRRIDEARKAMRAGCGLKLECTA